MISSQRCTLLLTLFLLPVLFLFGQLTQPLQADETIEPKPVELGREVNFDDDVAPILKENCLACHNAQTTEANLNLETTEGMLEGGDSGPAVIEGSPDASYLYLVASRQTEPVMPPIPNQMNAHKLTGEEVWKLKRWIELGAPAGSKMSQKAVEWSSMPSHLQPVYALELFPNENDFAVGRGNRVQVLSLTDPGTILELTDPELPTAHRDYVNAIAVHPDGNTLASAGYRCVKIWRKEAARVVAQTPLSEPVAAISADPSGSVALISDKGTLWFRQGEAMQSVQTGVTSAQQLAWNPQSQQIAILTPDAMQVAAVSAPTQLRTITSEVPVTAIAFWNNQLVTGHADGSVRLWQSADGQNWQVTGEAMSWAKASIQKATLIAEDKLVILAENGQVILGDPTNKNVVREWTTGSDTIQVACSLDLTRLATVHENGIVRLWDADGKAVQTIQKRAMPQLQLQDLERTLTISKSRQADAEAQQKAAVENVKQRTEAVAKSKEGLTAAEGELAKAKTAKEEAEAALKDAEAKLKESPEDATLKKQVEAAQKKKEEATAEFEKKATEKERAAKAVQLEEEALARAQTELKNREEELAAVKTKVSSLEMKVAEQKKQQESSPANAAGVAFIDNSVLRLVTTTGQEETWEFPTGRPLSSVSLAAAEQTKAVPSVKRNFCCRLRNDGMFEILDLSSHWRLTKRLGPPDGGLDVTQSQFVNRVTSLDFSPDGQLLATGGGDPSRDGELMLWNWREGTIQRKIEDAHSDVVYSVHFSHDGQQLLTGSADKFVKLFSVENAELIQAFEGHTEHVLDVAWKADGLQIASASADKTIKIWNVRDGSQIRTLSNFGKQVTSLEYIGLSDKLAACSGDQTVRMFQTSNGQNYRNFTGAQKFLNAFDVSSEEERVIAGAFSGVVRIWNGQNGQVLHTLDVQTEK